jgi:hypothetical protein
MILTNASVGAEAATIYLVVLLVRPAIVATLNFTAAGRTFFN